MKKIIVNLAFGYLADALKVVKDLPLVMVLLGKTFGPDGCRHFSELSPEEQTELLLRVPVLRGKHTDWPKAFRDFDRTLTCYVMPNNVAPVIILQTPDAGNIDIPAPSNYIGTRGYLAATFTDKLHVRGGFRWDVNGLYLEFPSFTIKQLQ